MELGVYDVSALRRFRHLLSECHFEVSGVYLEISFMKFMGFMRRLPLRGLWGLSGEHLYGLYGLFGVYGLYDMGLMQGVPL